MKIPAIKGCATCMNITIRDEDFRCTHTEVNSKLDMKTYDPFICRFYKESTALMSLLDFLMTNHSLFGTKY